MKSISTINTKTPEGQLLIAAISVITVSKKVSILGKEYNGQKLQPDEVLQMLQKVSDQIGK